MGRLLSSVSNRGCATCTTTIPVMDATKIPGRFRRLFTLFWSGIFGILARNPLVTFFAGCQNLLCSFEYWRESSRIFGNFKVNQGWCQPTHEFVALSSCPIRVPLHASNTLQINPQCFKRTYAPFKNTTPSVQQLRRILIHHDHSLRSHQCMI